MHAPILPSRALSVHFFKLCGRCRIHKPRDHFWFSKFHQAYYSYCKACYKARRRTRTAEESERGKDYRARNLEKERLRKRLTQKRDAALKKAKNPERVRARDILRKAVRRGKVEKPSRCSSCARELPARQIHGHHHNGYANPFDVVWLCMACHGLEHRGY